MGLSRTTIFTTIVSLVFLVLGYFGNRWYDLYKRKKELQEVRKYFSILVELLNGPIELQISTFLLFARRLERGPGKDYVLVQVAAFNLNNIKRVNNYDLYEVFLKGRGKDFKERVFHFERVQKSIRILEMIEQKYPEAFDDFLEKKSIHEKRWEEGATKIQELLVEYSSTLTKNNVVVGQDPFVDELIQLTRTFQKLPGKEEIEVSIKHFLKPMILICTKHIGNQRAVILLNLVNECLHNHDCILKLHKNAKRQFVMYARRLHSANVELKVSLKKLQ